MTARVANVTIHAENPAALAKFWSDVMGYPEQKWDPDEVAELKAAGLTDDEIAERAIAWDENPAHQRFYFARYTGHERRQRNRMHIDITPFDDRAATRDEVEAECARLVALGASVEKVLDEPWGTYEEFAIMMRDPEGNEFCLQ